LSGTREVKKRPGSREKKVKSWDANRKKKKEKKEKAPARGWGRGGGRGSLEDVSTLDCGQTKLGRGKNNKGIGFKRRPEGEWGGGDALFHPSKTRDSIAEEWTR